MIRYYDYEVHCSENDNFKTHIYHGIIAAKDLKEAASEVIDRYGPNIVSITVDPWEITGCIELSSDMLDQILSKVL